MSNALSLPIRNKCIKLVFADPPTNRGMNEGASNDTLDPLAHSHFILNWLSEAQRVMAYDSYLVICLYHKIRYLYEYLIHNASFPIHFDHEIIWDYNFGRYTKQRFVPSHDNLLVYTFGRPKFYWQEVAVESQRLRIGDKRADQRGRTPSSVWAIPREPGNSKSRRSMRDTYRRSCQPMLLCERVIKAYTSEGDQVLNLFSGSGTMEICCRMLKRPVISIDLCKHYCREAKNRYESNT